MDYAEASDFKKVDKGKQFECYVVTVEMLFMDLSTYGEFDNLPKIDEIAKKTKFALIEMLEGLALPGSKHVRVKAVSIIPGQD